MGLREAAAAVLVALPFALGLSATTGEDEPRPVLRLADPEIVESSGLVARDGLLQTVNDSGDSARVFTVDRDGRTVGVSRWDAEPVDVEALAPAGPGRVWVGDIGDNLAARETVTVTSVPVGRGEPTGDARAYRLSYPGGATDAEALLAHPRTGRLYVVTKDVLGAQVLAAPAELEASRVNRLRVVGRAMPLVTDGAFLPDGHHLVLRDYSGARVYTFPGLAEVGEVPLPEQQQGEGIAADEDGGLLVSSEGLHAPVFAVEPPAVARATAAVDAGATEKPAEAPSATGQPAPAGPAGPAHQPQEPWPWLVVGGALVLVAGVVVRSLRPR